MRTNIAFGEAEAVLFMEVSSLQGVLIRGVPLYLQHFIKCLVAQTHFTEVHYLPSL